MEVLTQSARQPWVVRGAAHGGSGSPCVRQAPHRLLPSPGLQQGFPQHRQPHQQRLAQLCLLRQSAASRRGLRGIARAQAQQPQPPRRAESPGPGIAGRPRPSPPAAAAAAATAAAAADGAYAIVAADAPSAATSGSSSGGAAAPPPPPQQEPPPSPGEEQAGKEDPELVLLMVACGIGLATGAAIVAFNVAVHEIRDWIWANQSLLASNRELLRNIAESELWPKVVFPPLLGGLLVGALGFAIGGYDDKPAPRLQQGSGSGGGASSSAGAQADASAAGAAAATSSSYGSSASAVLEQWRLQMAVVLRPVSRAVAAAITLGTGASLGPEGPSVDIGKSTAKALGSSLRSRQRHLTSLLAAGAGAGVAAGFNAPIAGVFFAYETVLQKQKVPKLRSEADPAALQRQLQEAARSLSPSAVTIAMVLLAAVLAAIVSQAGLGSSPAFRVPEYRLESLYELPLYLFFGAVCGVVSASFSFSTRVATDAFDELREQNSIEAALMPCIGGLTTGVLALGYPEILYQGFDNVNNILSSNGAYAPGLLIQIVVMKVIATSICRGSGLQGGLYAPSIFIGAALGTAFGLLAHALGDPLGLHLSAPQAYALVGVAAMLASNCQVPLTSVLLLFELTRDYLIILPTLATVGISFWISSLAAPSVKNAASARRMSAAAAASAAVATTWLKPADTEAVLIGGLQGRLAAALAQQQQQQQQQPANGAAAAATAAPAGGAGAAPSEAAPGPGSQAAPSDARAAPGDSFDGFDRVPAAPAALAAAAMRAGEHSLPVSAALERSCLLVEADMAVSRALELMHADDQHVAVVLGEDGGVMGLVTRDVLEECVEAARDARAGVSVAAAGRHGNEAPSEPSSDGRAGDGGDGAARG